jgi:hypothetical protein
MSQTWDEGQRWGPLPLPPRERRGKQRIQTIRPGPVLGSDPLFLRLSKCEQRLVQHQAIERSQPSLLSERERGEDYPPIFDISTLRRPTVSSLRISE